MATNPELDRRCALSVYQLGEAVVRLRRTIEVYYVGADEVLDCGYDRPPPINNFVDVCLGRLRETTCLLATNGLLVENSERIDQLLNTAVAMRDRMEAAWMEEDHRSRLRKKQTDCEKADGLGDALLDLAVLTGSPLAPSAWQEYQDAADCVGAGLPPCLCPLFDLSRLLAAIVYPLPSDYSDSTCSLRLDPEYLQGELSPRVTILMRAFRSGCCLLDGLPERFDGARPDAAAINLHKAILSHLESGIIQTEVESIFPPRRLDEVPIRCDQAASHIHPGQAQLSVSPLEPKEDFEFLLSQKKQMDKDDTYIGQSLAVLRLFHHMADLNRLPDDPVLILGPTGAGKTRLARLLHDTSARGKRPFLGPSSDELVGGDDTVRRVRWAGYGINSGLPNVNQKKGAKGWLQLNEGGTIFVDEMHDLDEASFRYLRKPLDRDQEMLLALGEGESFKPDVRLIFATRRTVEDLQREGKIPVDFWRRLRNRFLTVPPLRERKEDIPLFVEKFRKECRPEECFYLALLYHNWERGQVDELISTIRTVVARKGERGTLLVSDLRDLVPDEVIARVTQLTGSEVGRDLYLFLIKVLETQGFRHRSRGMALQKRLAQLLCTSESGVSVRLRDLGLRPSDSGEQTGGI